MPKPFFVREVQNPLAIAGWLFFCCLLVYCMVLLGGYTRLTHSGLSMVNWAPIMGTLPPLSESQWLQTFAQYKQFPEYLLLNQSMDLAGFKAIFWVEYAHRLLGRLIGLAYFLPFLFFIWRRNLSAKLALRLAVIFLLGGLQGLMGWYMVKSGLVNDPNVSQYRLTAHLLLAVLVFGLMLWLALGLANDPSARFKGVFNPAASTVYCQAANFLILLLLLMIISGGFVAGTRAGFIFNSWPKMGDVWIPGGLWALQPKWLNLFENPVTIQFMHRALALLVLFCVGGFNLLVYRRHSQNFFLRRAAIAVLLLLLVQFSLGVSTLVLNVPLILAVAHQGGAIALFATVVFLRFQLQMRGRITNI